MEFDHRVVFFKQPGCPACAAMEPVWYGAADEINEEYPHLRIGFGEWDVTTDDWAFLDSAGGDGTPNFAVFNKESQQTGLNTEGILSKTELKDFIISCCQ
jgi:hypothetical protein